MPEEQPARSPGPRDPADVHDAALLARIADADREAFGQLFHRYRPRLHAFVRRRVGEEEAEDVVVDVFYEVWRSAARFRGESRASTWICGIAHFKCLSLQRALGRGKRSAVTAVDAVDLERMPSDEDTQRVLEARDEVRRVERVLRTLPEGQREVVQLAFVDGLAYDEIAERLGVAEATVKTRVARARARLREELELALETERS